MPKDKLAYEAQQRAMLVWARADAAAMIDTASKAAAARKKDNASRQKACGVDPDSARCLAMAALFTSALRQREAAAACAQLAKELIAR